MLLPEHTKHVKHLENLLTKVWKGINCQLNTARGKYWNVVFNLAAVSVIAVLCFMQQKHFFSLAGVFWQISRCGHWSEVKVNQSASDNYLHTLSFTEFMKYYTTCEIYWLWVMMMLNLSPWGHHGMRVGQQLSMDGVILHLRGGLSIPHHLALPHTLRGSAPPWVSQDSSHCLTVCLSRACALT